MKTSLANLFAISLVTMSTALSAQSPYLVGLEFDNFLSNGVFINGGSTGTVNDGVPTGNVTLVGGVIGVGINLTGNGDEVASGPSPLAGSQSRTVSIWANTTVSTGIVTPMTFGTNGNGSKWDMDIDCSNGGVFELGVGGGRTTGQGPALNDGAWHLLTAVLPAGATTVGGARLFVDGNFAYTNSGTRAIATGAGSLIVGRAANMPAFQEFIGDVDDLAIWSEGMTDEQVKCLYDVATNSNLAYTSSQFEQLLQVFRNTQPGVTVLGRSWVRATGLSGQPGLNVLGNNGFELVMDANGNGVQVIQSGSFTTFGQGCAGSAGIPTLTSTAVPQINQTFTSQISNIPAGSSAFGVVGFSGTLVPTDAIGMTGCQILSSHLLAVMLNPVGGVATFNVPLPASALGLTFYEQGYIIDIPANPFGLTSTNAGAASVGP